MFEPTVFSNCVYTKSIEVRGSTKSGGVNVKLRYYDVNMKLRTSYRVAKFDHEDRRWYVKRGRDRLWLDCEINRPVDVEAIMRRPSMQTAKRGPSKWADR